MAHATAARAPRRAPPRRAGIRWDRLGRVGLLSVLGIILLLYVSPIKHWIEQSRTAGEQRSELRDLTRENRRLERRVHGLRTSGALEREARRLGMIRHDERSFSVENLPR
jgi:cell division protein FtsB